MLDTVGLTDHVEAHWPRINGVPDAGQLRELDAIVGENGVDLIGDGFEHVLQKLLGGALIENIPWSGYRLNPERVKVRIQSPK